MKNTHFEGRYISPEEIRDYVLDKFADAEEHHEKYHEFWIDSCVGYSAPGTPMTEVSDAIIVIKSGTDVVYFRIVDGKLIGDRPDEFYLVYRSEKYLVCALRQNGKERYIKIKDGNDYSLEDDITVFVMIHHSGGIFNLYFTPDEAKFVEHPIIGNDTELATTAKAIKRFFHLPSNFRSLPKGTEESEDDE